MTPLEAGQSLLLLNVAFCLKHQRWHGTGKKHTMTWTGYAFNQGTATRCDVTVIRAEQPGDGAAATIWLRDGRQRAMWPQSKEMTIYRHASELWDWMKIVHLKSASHRPHVRITGAGSAFCLLTLMSGREHKPVKFKSLEGCPGIRASIFQPLDVLPTLSPWLDSKCRALTSEDARPSQDLPREESSRRGHSPREIACVDRLCS